MNHSRVPHPVRVGWIASLMKQLLEEVRVAPVSVAARTRIAEIHGRSVNRLERRLALDVVNELEGSTLPFCGQERRHTELGVGQDRPVSRIDRLLDNIETSQSGQQRQLRRMADARRSTEAAAIAHTAPEGAAQDADDRPHDDSSHDHG